MKTKKLCRWKEDEDGNFETSCGDIFCLTDGTPKENRYNFCPNCGGKLKLKEFKPE